MKKLWVFLIGLLVACGSSQDESPKVDRFALDDDSGLPSCNSIDSSIDVDAEAGEAEAGEAEAGTEAGTDTATDVALMPGVLFFDDFTSTLSSEWTAFDRHTDYSNSEVGCYRPANVTVVGGNLDVETRVENSTCGDATHSPAAESFTSGAVQWATRTFTIGTIEVRAKLAGGTGPWPAVWLLGTDCQAAMPLTADNIGTCNWPNPGSDEIDIVDAFSDRTHPNQSVHSSVANGSCPNTVISDMSVNWHVYSLTRTSNLLTWKVDGAVTCQLGSGQFPTSTMFMVMNASMRGVNGSTLPQQTLIDYVLVTDGTVDAGAEAAIEPQPEPAPEPMTEPTPEAGSEPLVEATPDAGDSDVLDASAEAEASGPRVLVGEATAWLPGAPTNGVADGVSSGTIEAFKYAEIAPAGAFTKLAFYATTSGRTLKLGLYSHNATSNQPQTLLASGAFTSIVGWNTVTVPSTAVTSGGIYWIAVLSTNGTINFVEKSDSPGAGLGSVSAGIGLSALPATWSTTGQLRWNSSGMSAYAKE